MTTFTKCANCAFADEVLEPDRFGVKRPSLEVIQCEIFMQFRAVRIVRSCASFQQRKRVEATA